MSVALRRIYCIDTSSLIYCQHAFGDRPSKVQFYAAVWDLLDRLAGDGRMQAPHLAFGEITKNNDHIGQWAHAHAAVFRPKGEHAARVVEILKEPGQRLVAKTAPRGAEEADPWVIALAEGINAVSPTLWDQQIGVVVGEEAKVGGIADICRRRTVEHLDFTGMLSAEGLSFGPPPTSA